MKYYSQYGQDKFLYENFFTDKKDGFFIDIGAHNGIHLSNTYFFENLGWSGFCFEPIPTVFNELQKNRKCNLINCALSNKKGFDDFLMLEGYTEMLSGLVNEYDQNHLIRINNEILMMGGKKNVIKCETVLFEDYNFPENIDYISLDVEGAEMTILKTIDFEKHKIKFMTIEVNHSAKEIENFMVDKGFEKISNLGCDFVFKNKN